MIGNVIDKYEVIRKVGEGGMATVYLGRHTTLGREVAIKVLHPHLSSSPRNRQRFAREARAIEQLDHPGIVRIFDYSGQESDDCFIVTEFIDGITLQQFGDEQGRLPSEAAARIGIQLAECLGYAHARGIVHRDLKPANIMIRRDGAIKLMDFGIARFVEESQVTVTGALIGSPAFMSPEQAMERVIDGRSDLFSLGTVLFHLVTGSLPFQGQNPSVILRNIIDGNRPRLLELAPEASASFADVVERLLQTDPSTRIQSAEELSEALKASFREVGLDSEDPLWSTERLIVDVDTYRHDLEAFLKISLLEQGRKRIDEGDFLGALRLFNRLLAIDPENETVLQLVQGLHSRPEAGARSRWRWTPLVLGAVALLAVGGGLLLFGHPDGQEQQVAALEPIPPAGMSRLPGRVDEAWVLPGEKDLLGQIVENSSFELQPELRVSPQAVEAAVRFRQQGLELQPNRAGSSTGEPVKSSVSSLQVGAPDEKATVRVVLDSQTWAKIIIDGEDRGYTGRKPITVSPGQHKLILRNDFSEPHEESFTVSPGQNLTIDGIMLRPLPAQVVIRPSIEGACRVRLDGTSLGTVASLGGRFSLPDPRKEHLLLFDCGAGGGHQMTIGPVQAGSVVHAPEAP